MSAQLLAGKPVAEAVLADVSRRTEALKQKGIKPGLGTILVGDDGPSASYVKKKHETCEQVGIVSFHHHIAADKSQNDLLAAVEDFNNNPEVDAYIIQNPVPAQFDFNQALAAMNPAKDADGLHPISLGKLVLQEPGPLPCTPLGIRTMLIHYGIETSGKEVVVIGRGPTLGRPLALLMSQKAEGANAAVTVVHSAVANIADYTRRADILVAALGRPRFVTPEMVKRGAVVVSGGISWEGKKLLPDVDEAVAEVASWITPRLGGVGPTTVAMLLKNTIEVAERR